MTLLRTFVKASNMGKTDDFIGLLADNAVLIADGGPEGARVAGVRNLPAPLVGATKLAPFLAAFGRRDAAARRERRECELNGQPAIVALENGRHAAALLRAVADGKIAHIFLRADPTRLAHLGLIR